MPLPFWIFIAGAFLVGVGVTVDYRWLCKKSDEAWRARREANRAEPVDLGKERYEYCSRRDSFLEDQQLRRVA